MIPIPVQLSSAKFYCPHAIADGNKCIRIREKMLEFSAVLSTLSPYHTASFLKRGVASRFGIAGSFDRALGSRGCMGSQAVLNDNVPQIFPRFSEFLLTMEDDFSDLDVDIETEFENEKKYTKSCIHNLQENMQERYLDLDSE